MRKSYQAPQTTAIHFYADTLLTETSDPRIGTGSEEHDASESFSEEAEFGNDWSEED